MTKPLFKKESTIYKEIDKVELGDIITTCNCFYIDPVTMHTTDSHDGETCNYCGFFVVETRAKEKDVRKYNSEKYKDWLLDEKKKRKLFLDKERLHDTKLH